MAEANLQYIIQVLAEDGDAASKLNRLGMTLDQVKEKANSVREAILNESAALSQLDEEAYQAGEKIRSAYAWIPENTNAVSKHIAILKRLQMQLGNVEKQQGSSSQAYRRLSEQYKEAKLQLIDIAAATDKSFESLAGLTDKYSAQASVVSDLRTAHASLKGVIDEVTAAQEKRTPEEEKEIELTGTLRNKLYQCRMELAKMAEAGQIGSDAYKKLSNKAKELRREQALVNATMSEGTGWQASIGLMRAAVGVWATATGAMQALGLSTEDAAKAEKRFQSIMSVAVGLQQIANTFRGDSIVMQGVYITQKKAEAAAELMSAKAKGKNTAATWLLTAAQKAFNAVAAMNPYVLLAMAIASVIGAMYLLVSATRNSAEAKERQQKAIEKINKAMDKEKEKLTALQREHRREMDLLKAKGKSSKTIHDERIRNLREEKAAMEQQIITYKKLVEAEKQRLIAEGQLKMVNGVLTGKKDIAENYNKMIKEIRNMQETAKDLVNEINVENASFKQSSIDTQREITDAIRQAMQERTRIKDSYYASERKRLEDEKKAQLENINAEERKWNREKGTKNSSFEKRRNNVELQFAIDTKKLEDDFKKWKEEFEKGTATIEVNMQLETLRDQLAVETDINRQHKIREQLMKAEQRQRKDQLTTEMNSELVSRMGSKQGARLAGEYYNADAQGKKDIVAKANGIVNEKDLMAGADIIFRYYQRLQTVTDELQRGFEKEVISDTSNRLISYIEAETEALEWRNKELEQIKKGASELTEDDVEKIYTRMMDAAATNYGMPEGSSEAIATSVRDLVTSITKNSLDEIINQYDTFQADMQRKMSVNTKMAGLFNAAGADRGDDGVLRGFNGEQVTTEEQLLAMDVLQQQFNVDVEDGAELFRLMQERLSENSVILKMLTDMSNKMFQVMKNGTSKENEDLKKQQLRIKNTVQSFKLLATAANDVAQVFGSALSKEAKKALGTISGLSDAAAFAITSIGGLGKEQLKVLQDMGKGVKTSAEVGKDAITTMERASVILTVISIALEIAMKIANVVKQFTKSAQLQESIDNLLEKVDELTFEQQKLQNQYKNEDGTRYYKSMARAAEQYNQIIAKSNEAVSTAYQLYQHLLRVYGENSDKTKDAKQQWQDLILEMQDYKNEQKDMYEELMESLTGTSLDSFASNLADALIDGFRQGAEEISDVWEDTLDDLMSQMMRQQLALAITDMFKDVFTRLNDATKNGELTQSEIDSIIAQFDAKTEEAKNLARTYYELMSERGLLDDEDTEASQGFGQMTQDQADTLTARFTALQIEGANVVASTQQIVANMADVTAATTEMNARVAGIADVVEINCGILRDQLEQLEIISENTAALASMDARLQAIEQNTARL